MNPDISKAYRRYAKAVEKVEAAVLARLEQEDVVHSEQAELAHRVDAVNRALNEADNRRDDIISIIGRES